MFVVMVMGIIGCPSVNTARTNTNYGYSLNAQTKSNLKIPDDIFDILKSPLGRPLQENMQPLSRKTGTYRNFANTDSAFRAVYNYTRSRQIAYRNIFGVKLHAAFNNVYNVTKLKIKDSYERQNRTDILEIHDVNPKNNRVYAVSLIWKSQNRNEIEALKMKFLDLVNKKFGNYEEYNDGISKNYSKYVRWEENEVTYLEFPITKYSDGNYVFLVCSLDLGVELVRTDFLGNTIWDGKNYERKNYTSK